MGILNRPEFGPVPDIIPGVGSPPAKPKKWEAPMAILRDHPGQPAKIAEFKHGRTATGWRTVAQTRTKMHWFVFDVNLWLYEKFPYDDWTFNQRTREIGHIELWATFNGVLTEAQFQTRKRLRAEREPIAFKNSRYRRGFTPPPRLAVVDARNRAMEQREANG